MGAGMLSVMLMAEVRGCSASYHEPATSRVEAALVAATAVSWGPKSMPSLVHPAPCFCPPSHPNHAQSCGPLLLTSPNGSSFPLRGVDEVLRGAVLPDHLLTPPDVLGDDSARLGPAALANQVRAGAGGGDRGRPGWLLIRWYASQPGANEEGKGW